MISISFVFVTLLQWNLDLEIFKQSQAILFYINEDKVVEFASRGADNIGITINSVWEHSTKGHCSLNGEDYLIQADLDDLGGYCFLLQPLKKQQVMLQALDAMSQCVLDNIPLLDGKLGNAMQRAVSTLNEAMKQSLDGAKSLEVSAEELFSSSNILKDRSIDVSTKLEETLATTTQLDSSVQDNINAADNLVGAVSSIDSDISLGQDSIKQANTQIDQIRERVKETQNIVSVIDEISFKTNLLSLNAAVEAARAGEQGRGFSIVAQEVRALAGHSAAKAKEIRELLNRTHAASENGQKVMLSVNDCLGNLFSKIESISDSVIIMQRTADNQTTAMKETSIALNGIEQVNNQNAASAESLSNLAERVKSQSQFMRDAMEVFSLQSGFSHPKHEYAFNLAKQASLDIASQFETAIQNSTIKEEALFSRDYEPISGTNPTKFTTHFDKYCDNVLPSIQEMALSSSEYINYLIASDNNGYVPTHNNKFCQPLSGNYDKDLASNRTKRIFTDRVGKTCGTHQKDYLIQTYRRDTGEVLIDLSVPIYVNGKHWGAIRCGYAL